MVETAIANFRLSLEDAWNLTLAGYVTMARAWRRRVREEHERDVWLAWLTGQFSRGPVPYRTMLKIARGRGSGDDGADEVTAMLDKMRRRQEFEAWFQADQAQEAANGGRV